MRIRGKSSSTGTPRGKGYSRMLLIACGLSAVSMACKSPAERDLEAARLAIGRGQFEQALDLYTEVVLRAPATAEAARAVYGIGIIHYLKYRDLDTARASFRKILYEYPESEVASDARRALGRLYEKEEGELDKAIQEYSLLLEKGDRWEKEKSILLDLANCHYQLNHIEQASSLYRRVIENYPYDESSDPAYIRLAQMEALAGDVESSQGIIEELLTCSDLPDSRRRGYLLTAESMMQSSRYDSCRLLLKRAGREFPGDAELLALEDRLNWHEMNGRSLDGGDEDSQILLEEMRSHIRWGRGKRGGSGG